MPDFPLVSICIPCYNAAQYLRETVASARAQTYPNIEINIRDNASTDGTAELLSELAAADPRVRIFRNETNIGMAGNWNAVINDARGEYLSLLSADDLLLPAFVAECVALLGKTGADAVSAEHAILSGGVRRRRPVTVPSGMYEAMPELILRRNPFSINFTLFRRSGADKFSAAGRLFQRNLYAADYDLWLRMMLGGGKIYFTDRGLGLYRWHDGNLSRNKFKMLRHVALVLGARRESLLRACPFAFRLKTLRLLASALLVVLKTRHADRRLLRALCLSAAGMRGRQGCFLAV